MQALRRGMNNERSPFESALIDTRNKLATWSDVARKRSLIANFKAVWGVSPVAGQ